MTCKMRNFVFQLKFQICLTAIILTLSNNISSGQATPPQKLPDTGQIANYTAIFGEDSDYLINAPSFTDNGNGTVTDNITGLMWQKVDGGEMTVESAAVYCENLVFGGYSDWRLPTCHELFSILNHGKTNPALDTAYFTKTTAEYWWSADKQIDNATKIWVTNAGGGIGAHPKTETISAGGTKRFHVRAVRTVSTNPSVSTRFLNNNDGTVLDRSTGLVWQSNPGTNTLTWDDALNYSENLSLGGKSDWRLPNIKELQSLNSEILKNPSIDTSFFGNISPANYWSSTTLNGTTTKAWYLNFSYGLTSYETKTVAQRVICVRGESALSGSLPEVVLIAGGNFVMGDHHGYVDPQHPSDELPLHQVHLDSFYIGKYELTNQQFCDFLNSAKSQGLIEVRNNIVYATGDTNIYCYTSLYASYSSIAWNGTVFSVADFRAKHPVVGIMWFGAAAYCNWLSQQAGLVPCYNLSTWSCDFTKPGYRLPTEAEWEYAGRGAQYNPYYVFPWGNDSTNVSLANWPNSGDPYETGNYPWTTPVGFYNGELKLKSEYNWPGSQTSYQTSNGSNAYGLFDMAGNVWEFVNDWYGQNYYSISPVDNPKGPATGFIMPDGKPYRGMRGGNWYNGQWGHSRVANRNPSYYRGPQDPNHPWYHIGFRVVRYFVSSPTDIGDEGARPGEYRLYPNFPNPFNPSTTIRYSIPVARTVRLEIYDNIGNLVSTPVNDYKQAGSYEARFDASGLSSGVYFYRISSGNFTEVKKMILLK